MKLFFRIPVLVMLAQVCFTIPAFPQTANSIDQLKQKLNKFQQHNNLNDTNYANTIIDLAYLYSSGYPDSALLILKGNAERCRTLNYYIGEVSTYMIAGDAFQTKGMYEKALENYKDALQLAKKNNYQKGLSLTLNRIGIIHLNQGNYPVALSNFYEALKEAETAGNNDLIGSALNNIAAVQFYQNKFNEAESTYTQKLKLAETMHDSISMSHAYNNLGEVNLKQKNPVKALHNLVIAYNLASKISDREMLFNTTLSIAETYYTLDSLQKSASLYENVLQLSTQTGQGTIICNALIGLAKVRYKQNLLKEALSNGLQGLQKAETIGQVQLMRDANEIVAEVYEAMNDGNNALRYYKQYKVYSDSMNNLASQRSVAIEKASYEFSKKELEFERKTAQQEWIIGTAFIGLLLLAIIVWAINRNKKRLDRTNKELHKKNILIEQQKLKAEDTLHQLQAAQAQLIQSEKMASLGELTAGIAHEIQNPLNFVTNFSEVSCDLLDEMKDELVTGNLQPAIEIANNVKENLEKIKHHGKRADAIVKGMLQHSRQTKGVKEPTDINALCDEYLRLSYHGLRAKDKSFNADFKTDFDESLGKISIVPQDVGRVLLNLINNAFYAVSEKQKSADKNYKPLVMVATKSLSPLEKGWSEISITDNGNGIPSNIIDKIFQPFFTTKPTGQGTGLGLSLSYDIIKAQGGAIKVETSEGEGTTFIIKLPV